MFKRKSQNGVDVDRLFGLKTDTTDQKINKIGVIVEEMASSMKLLAEKVESSETSLRQTMEEIQEKNEKRFNAIEAAVTHHTGELAEIKADIVGIKTDIVEVKSSIKQLDEKMTKRVDDHEQRIVTIEKTVVLA